MNSGDKSNAIGDRGEAIFVSNMTKFHGDGPIFRRPIFLGEKWPLVDFVCELYGPWNTLKPFFFVQVKATMNGYTKGSGRLKISASRERARGLQAYKVPVYLAGVDAKSERVFIVAASGQIKGLSSLHTGFELDAHGRRKVWEEVRDFWRKVPRPANWTTLKEPLWK